MVKEWSEKVDYKILPLTDSQAFVVIDNEGEVIE